MSGLYLNYCFCYLSDTEETINSIPYNANMDLHTLRSKYDGCCFMRDGNSILYWASQKTQSLCIENYNSNKIIISHKTTPKVICKLIENKIYSIVENTGAYELYFEKYSNCMVIKKKESIYSDKVIEINQCIKISTYYFKDKETYYYGFTASPNLRYNFKISKSECDLYGIDANGLQDNKSGKVAANRQAILRYKKASGLKDKLSKIENQYENRVAQFNNVSRMINWIVKKLEGTLYGNIAIENCKINYFPYDKVFSSEILKAPQKYYANDAIISGKPSDALLKVGPYKAQSTDNNIKISVIALKENQGSLNVFTRALSDKLKDFFRLNVVYHFEWVDNENVTDYVSASLKLNAKSTDLALYIVKSDQKMLPIVESPYYNCKAKLIGQEIPTQCICIETIRRINDFVIGNIALNIYAKFGGTAWGIEKHNTTTKELIIGIGSTLNSRKQQVLSIANVFDNSGVYLAGTCNPLIDFTDYSVELEKLIRELLLTLLSGEENVNIIFHIYKSASKHTEIRAIENVIKKFSDIKIYYAFVHLGYGHNFRMYNNDGKDDIRKGQIIQLSQTESLLIVNDKSIVPLKLTLDSRSTFKDIYYITEQAFFFAHLSERSFSASKKPITILYPSIMANLIEKLKRIDKWDSDRLKVKGVTEKLWFL